MRYEIAVPKREFQRLAEGTQTFLSSFRSLEVQRGDVIEIFEKSERPTNEISNDEVAPDGDNRLYFVAGFVDSSGTISLIGVQHARRRRQLTGQG